MNYIIGEIKLRPIFIIPDLNELEKLRKQLQSALNIEVIIKKLGNYKTIYISNELYKETLKAGLIIAESENIKGIWLDIFGTPRSLNCFPLRKYIIVNWLKNIIISTADDKEYLQAIKEEEEKNDRIKKYFEDLQKYLSHSLMITYDLEGNLAISIYCKYSELDDSKNRCLEFEQMSNLEGLLMSKDDNLELIRRLK